MDFCEAQYILSLKLTNSFLKFESHETPGRFFNTANGIQTALEWSNQWILVAYWLRICIDCEKIKKSNGVKRKRFSVVYVVFQLSALVNPNQDVGGGLTKNYFQPPAERQKIIFVKRFRRRTIFYPQEILQFNLKDFIYINLCWQELFFCRSAGGWNPF